MHAEMPQVEVSFGVSGGQLCFSIRVTTNKVASPAVWKGGLQLLAARYKSKGNGNRSAAFLVSDLSPATGIPHGWGRLLLTRSHERR